MRDSMKDYHIDGFHSGYIADIRELKACSAIGNTAAEVLVKVEIAKVAGLNQQRPTYRRPAIYKARRYN